MAVYDEAGSGARLQRRIAFYTSADLKQWERQSTLDGYYECPEIFELSVDGDPANPRWVVFAADAKYSIGRFDGKTFTPEHEGKHQVHWGRYYASQTFDRAPEGRRIQIGWGRIDMQGMPFNQMMTFPCQLTLRTTPSGVRMFAEPIREIELLHEKRLAVENAAVSPDRPLSIATSGRLFDIRATLDLGRAERLGLKIAGRQVVYDCRAGELDGMPLAPVEGKVRVQILVDRPSIEICGNRGRVYKTDSFRSQDPIEAIEVFAAGGAATVDSLEVIRSGRRGSGDRIRLDRFRRFQKPSGSLRSPREDRSARPGGCLRRGFVRERDSCRRCSSRATLRRFLPCSPCPAEKHS